ncbi:MAG TPA: hypothetical protein VGL86_02600 [Polyangia bacterium]|jgi:hypothetical protein
MRTLALVALIAAAGCNGTTGSGLVTFTARAGGPADVTPGGPIDFDTGSGFHVTLTMAQLHFGAVYLNQSVPSSGGPQEPCILPGIYVGQAFGPCDASGLCGVDVDLLSPTLTTFTTNGEGTVNQAVEADVWLTGGDINATDDPTPILEVTGTATRAADSWPFTSTITISSNRAIPPPNAAMPGANPICRERIASLIPVDFTLTDGGTLDLRIDPRGMFNSVDFATLAPSGSTTTLTIPDTSDGAGQALYKGVLANAGVYEFTWTGK